MRHRHFISLGRGMLNYDDKRNYTRMNVDCDMTYKLVDTEQVIPARCTSLSGAGVAFITDNPINIGQIMEIQIQPNNPGVPPLSAFIEANRMTGRSDGKHEIAAIIKSIKGI